jgi:hypothetical protein
VHSALLALLVQFSEGSGGSVPQRSPAGNSNRTVAVATSGPRFLRSTPAAKLKRAMVFVPPLGTIAGGWLSASAAVTGIAVMARTTLALVAAAGAEGALGTATTAAMTASTPSACSRSTGRISCGMLRASLSRVNAPHDLAEAPPPPLYGTLGAFQRLKQPPGSGIRHRSTCAACGAVRRAPDAIPCKCEAGRREASAQDERNCEKASSRSRDPARL